MLSLSEFDNFISTSPLEEIYTYLNNLNYQYRQITQDEGYYKIPASEFFINHSNRFNSEEKVLLNENGLTCLAQDDFNKSGLLCVDPSPSWFNHMLKRIHDYIPHNTENNQIDEKNKIFLIGQALQAALRVSMKDLMAYNKFHYTFLNLASYQKMLDLIDSDAKKNRDFTIFRNKIIRYNREQYSREGLDDLDNIKKYLLYNFQNINQILYSRFISAEQIAHDGEYIYLSPACYFSLKFNIIFIFEDGLEEKFSMEKSYPFKLLAKYLLFYHYHFYAPQFNKIYNKYEFFIDKQKIIILSNEQRYILNVNVLDKQEKKDNIPLILQILLKNDLINSKYYKDDNEKLNYKSVVNYAKKMVIEPMEVKIEKLEKNFAEIDDADLNDKLSYETLFLLSVFLKEKFVEYIELIRKIDKINLNGGADLGEINEFLMENMDYIYENYLNDVEKYNFKREFNDLLKGTNLRE